MAPDDRDDIDPCDGDPVAPAGTEVPDDDVEWLALFPNRVDDLTDLERAQLAELAGED